MNDGQVVNQDELWLTKSGNLAWIVEDTESGPFGPPGPDQVDVARLRMVWFDVVDKCFAISDVSERLDRLIVSGYSDKLLASCDGWRISQDLCSSKIGHDFSSSYEFDDNSDMFVKITRAKCRYCGGTLIQRFKKINDQYKDP